MRLALSLWLQERRKWLRWLGVIALALVIVQGVLGGLRVTLLEHSLAIVHASLAQAFFALTVSLALFTSPEWREKIAEPPLAAYGRLRRLAAVTTGLIYLQVLFGAVLRHTGLATRCPFVVCRAGNIARRASHRAGFSKTTVIIVGLPVRRCFSVQCCCCSYSWGRSRISRNLPPY